MPNGQYPNPRDLQITVTGTPGDVNSWRTAALPPSHGRDQGYYITPADRERITHHIDQLLDAVTGAPGPAVAVAADGRTTENATPDNPQGAPGTPGEPGTPRLADGEHNWTATGDRPPQ